MVGEHYSAFVEEAFIKPIRSVLIIDDDYPTFDEMLDAEIARQEKKELTGKKEWHTDPSRIKRVIANFRTPEHPLLVDIHDGTNVAPGAEIKIASHLHQSDLLVLDYQLEKAKPGDGTLAIEIMRSLVSNDHFNLVVVHTSEDLETVFQDTLISLMSPLTNRLTGEESQQAQKLLIDADDKVEFFSGRLKRCVGVGQYLHARRFEKTFLRTMSKSQQPYSAFRTECDPMEWEGTDRKLVLRYLLEQVEESLSSHFMSKPVSRLSWDDGAIKYINADSVFIAFSAKRSEDDLLSEVLEALKAWSPQPSRLFLAKLRAEMDEYGVMAQGVALENQHALANWYRRLLESTGASRRWLVAKSVSRHAEQLMAGILPRVEDYANRLIESEAASGDPCDLSKEHFNIDLKNQADNLKSEHEHNAFVCSKPPEGWHLTTGHVFLIGESYWVCVSPACDTVPTQLSPFQIAAFGERLPFMAVKLTPLIAGRTIKDVQTNRYVFLRIDGAVTAFCFNDPISDISAPAWHMMYAEQRGVFSDGFEFKVLVTAQETDSLVQQEHSARVISQLRYEYALNLVQRLGGSLVRIGLDFVG